VIFAKLHGWLPRWRRLDVFDGLAHRFRRRRLQGIKRELVLKMRSDLEKARKEGTRLDEKTHYFDQINLDLIEDDIAQLVSDRLQVLADRYLIPLPPAVVIYEDTKLEEGQAWERSRVTNRYHLTPTVAAQLRADIRKEKREGSELAFRWLSSPTGLLGVLVGLAALFVR
jgi:hypothetical protein